MVLDTTQEQFQDSFEHAPVGIAHLDLQGYFLRANLKFCSYFGVAEAELKNTDFRDLMPPGAELQFQRQLDTLPHSKKKSFHCEQQFRSRTSACFDGHLSVSKAPLTSHHSEFLIVVLEDTSKRKLLESRLSNAEQQMKKILESISDLVFVCTVQNDRVADINVAPTYPHYQNFNHVVQAMSHYFWDQTTASQWLPVVHRAFQSGKIQALEYSLFIMDEQVWFSASVSPMKNQQFLWVAHNISDRKRAEQALFEEKKLAQVTLDSIGDAVVTTDTQGRVTQFNPIAERITGWTNDEVRGRDITDIFNVVHESSHEPLPNPIQLALSQGTPIERNEPSILIARHGTEYTIESSAAPILDQSGQVMGAVMIFNDVTYARALTRQLSWQATHDPLTKLVNRRHFDNILQNLLKESQQDGREHVLCFLDLDKFKAVNDTAGHAAGDELLCQIVKLIKGNIRDSDTLARLGGDEFALLLYKCPLDQAIIIAERLCHLVNTFQFSWDSHVFKIGVSIGLVQINAQSPSIDDVLSMADAACYSAKAQGRNRIQLYDDDTQQYAEQNSQQDWIARIRHALEHDQLCLYAQSIVSTSQSMSTEPYACEVLLRMSDAQGVSLPASEFVQLAERSNLIIELDRWVIKNLLQHLSTDERSQLLKYRSFMVNVSGSSLADPAFIQFLQESLATYPTLAEKLCFEITETTAITKLNQTTHFIQELKPFGCKFALDDFGHGMSSFGFLKAIPVDFLKIDGSFIVEMMEDPASQMVIEAINNVGHTMGMKTIAEHVENSSTRDLLHEIGVDYAQGYGIATPMLLT